jgi:hypothetical protein
MTEAVIVALVTGGLTLTGTVISNLLTHSKTIYRIEQLEKKQDKHNNLIERMYSCENAINILDEKQKNTEEDMKELKGRLEHAS